MRKFAMAALAAVTVATPALAQDAAPAADAPFTGPRVEAIVGYDTIDIDGVGSRDGVTYGAQLGYDAQFGGVILGAEGEIADSTVKARASNVFVGGDRLRVNAGRDLYAGLRAGVLVSPQAMAYVKGGYTNQRFSGSYTSGNTTTRNAANAEGWRVGAGLEYQLSGQTYVKGEYRYSRYDSVTDRHQVLAGVGMRF